MYLLESFENGYALVTRDDEPYRAMWRAADDAEASALVAGLNRPLLLDMLAVRRLEVETGGLDVNGMTVKTDRESQSQLTGAHQSLANGLIPDTDWKGSNAWAAVTAEEIAPIARAVALHVRACFKVERMVAEELNAITDNDALMSQPPQDRFNQVMTQWLIDSGVILADSTDTTGASDSDSDPFSTAPPDPDAPDLTGSVVTAPETLDTSTALLGAPLKLLGR